MNITTSLQSIGLSDKESQTYIAVLELGTGTATEISRRTGIGRSTTYFLLDELAKKALVSFLDKGKILHYTAEAPSAVQDRSRQQAAAIDACMPELDRLWREAKGDAPRVRFFQGLNNIKRMYDEILTLRWKNFYVFGSTEFWYKADKEWFLDYMKRRADAGIVARLILEDSSEAREQKMRESKFGKSQVKIIAEEYTQIKKPTSDVTILPDRIIYQNYGRERTSTVIHSRESADLMRIWHEMMWQQLD